jgi:hypothetical protein
MDVQWDENNSINYPIIHVYKGQPGARSSRLRRVREGSDHFTAVSGLHFFKSDYTLICIIENL